MAGFEFVSVAHPDDLKKRETRRRIGQHVMKDIGLSRRKPKPKKRETDSLPQSGSKDETAVQVNGLSKAIESNAHLASNPGDEFTKSPLTVLSRNYAARSAKIEILLTRRNSPMCRKHRELFYTLAMTDDGTGAFQLAMADAALFEAAKPVGRFNLVQENPWAMQHYTACVAVISKRITSAGYISQNLLGTIIGLASYDLTIRNFERWQTHIKGVKSLVQRRGGLASIESDYVMNSILWSDMCGSLNVDTQPTFLVDRDYRDWNDQLERSEDTPSTTLSRTINILQARSPEFADLCSMLQSLPDLCRIATKIPTEKWVDEPRLIQTICSVSHTILSLPRHGELPGLGGEAALFETVRLAAMLFITGLACRLCGETDILMRQIGRLPKLLKSETVDWTGLEELRLWVYVLGARVEEEEGRQWFVPQICELLKDTDIGFKGMRYALHDIAWVDAALKSETDSLKREIKAAM